MIRFRDKAICAMAAAALGMMLPNIALAKARL
jgi:hypothetical protein